MKKNQNILDLEELVGCKIVGVVRALKPLGYSGNFNEYYGLKIDDSVMEKGLILWLAGDDCAENFMIEDFDEAEDFEEI